MKMGVVRSNHIMEIIKQYRATGMINNLESTSICDIKYKIVFLGNMSVGKSSIIQRFTYGNFDENRQDTVGIDFLSKNLQYEGRLYRLLLWDTAGQEKFRSLIPAYLRDAHCAVFVYDVTCEASFISLPDWINLFNSYKRKDAVMFIVANKIDLKQRRKVAIEQAYQFARNNQLGYCQVSAKKAEGISALFQSIIGRIQAVAESSEPIEALGDNQPPVSLQRFNGNSESRINKKARVKRQDRKSLQGSSCCSI